MDPYSLRRENGFANFLVYFISCLRVNAVKVPYHLHPPQAIEINWDDLSYNKAGGLEALMEDNHPF